MPNIKPAFDGKGLFKAKWPGVCHLCGFGYEADEFLHYVGQKIAHESCHGIPAEGSLDGPERRSAPTEVGYRVRGRRNHEKRCETCFLTHAGECP